MIPTEIMEILSKKLIEKKSGYIWIALTSYCL